MMITIMAWDGSMSARMAEAASTRVAATSPLCWRGGDGRGPSPTHAQRP